jgi:chromosome segregation protein
MYLKNLTVFGFKSFPNKVALNFLPGITAIVGPNGCGKSNVADAIRWVLGEQSAKALRGGEMADVIFNGTDQRKPLAMAEVSLTLGDVDSEQLRAAGVELAFNEVTVTRRVFRDGGSEYYLNKVACRLKDIQQLFMGTGVGRTSYSIMAQGNITQILSSRPEDRRLVFEEAAGITKFKAQKREALRKLEYTEQNLLRLADLIREVKRQIGSLQRQAGKARRYKQISGELQHLETQLARHQYDVLQVGIRERREVLLQVRAAWEQVDLQLQSGEQQMADQRRALAELEGRISGAQQQGLEIRNQIERHEERIQFNSQRIEEMSSQHAQALQQVAQAEDRRLTSEQELAELTERATVLEGAVRGQREVAGNHQQAVRGVEEQMAGLQEQLRRLQADAFSAAQHLTRVRNEVNALDVQAQGHAVRLEKLSSERVHLEEEQGRLEIHLKEFEANVAAERLDVQTRRGSVEERQARLRECARLLAETTQDLDRRLRQQAEVRSRLQVLQQLQESHEGFSSGALAALQHPGKALGSLSDRLRVPPAYVTAMESVLAHHLQVVLTDQTADVYEILAQLSAQKKGRASIAPLALRRPVERRGPDAVAAGALVAAEGPAASGGVAALSVIECDASVAPLLGGVLGGTWIMPDLAAATRCWEEAEGRLDFVTLQGEVLSRAGVFTGGSANGNGRGPASILGRKNLIADLRRELDGLQEQVEAQSRQRGALASEQTALQASLQEAQAALRAQEVAVATRQGEFNVLQASLQTLARKIETVHYEIQTLSAQRDEARQRRGQLSQQLEAAEGRERAVQQQMTGFNAELEERRAQRDQLQSLLSEAKVALAAEEQRWAACTAQREPVAQRIRELAAAAAQLRSEIGGCLERCAQAELEIEESRRQVSSLGHERESISHRLAEWSVNRDAAEVQVTGLEEALRAQRRRQQELQEQRGSLEVELAQKEMGVQNLADRMQQKYQIRLEDVRSECITITIVTEGPPKVETLSPEAMAARGVATDWDAVGQQVEALQRRLEEMGPVNLVAIEEYEETEQRYKFLSTQHDDLVQAKEQLLELINRINAQTREMFTDTFAKIRDNFRAMFAEVFGGGKADLLLVDEGDVLESGIEIVARPPGKQLQNISLLSGGEQTMTAVSLLFAIYQVKPSPFCVLDELDAPLDESNINRFVRILQRFLAHSQFVIITHNKRTIGMADVLYGVTMEERGVSKVVSVKFHRVDDSAESATVKPLEIPAGVTAVDSEEDAPHSPAETMEMVLAK